jgi:hypothetical protein
VTDTNCDPFYGGPCGNLGETLLRYIAGVGDDGTRCPPPTHATAPDGTDCGNYYYRPPALD